MNVFKQNKKLTSIFVTAGYPKLESTNEQLNILEQHGVDFVEVGIPFSDPLADGPVIQASSTVAIQNGMHLDVLFDQLSTRTATLPIVLMGYLNPVLNYGIDRFLTRCKEINVASVILPDLSVEIYQRFYQSSFEKCEIYPSFLITPETSRERVQKIAQLCEKSFVYLVSSNSTTGTEKKFGEDVLKRYKEIKTQCGNTPLCIGFGIKTKHDISAIHSAVDGAIIGSAYLQKLAMNDHVNYLKELI